MQEHKQLVLSDVRLSNLLQHLPGTCDTIAAALAAGGKVLVHCFAGISRSATVSWPNCQTEPASVAQLTTTS